MIPAFCQTVNHSLWNRCRCSKETFKNDLVQSGQGAYFWKRRLQVILLMNQWIEPALNGQSLRHSQMWWSSGHGPIFIYSRPECERHVRFTKAWSHYSILLVYCFDFVYLQEVHITEEDSAFCMSGAVSSMLLLVQFNPVVWSCWYHHV